MVVKYWEWVCGVLQQNVFLLSLVFFLLLALGALGLLHGLVNEHRALRPQVPWHEAMVAGSEFDVAPPTARHLCLRCQDGYGPVLVLGLVLGLVLVLGTSKPDPDP